MGPKELEKMIEQLKEWKKVKELRVQQGKDPLGPDDRVYTKEEIESGVLNPTPILDRP